MYLLYIIPKVCEGRVHARSVSFDASRDRTCAETAKGCLVVGNDGGDSRDERPEVSALGAPPAAAFQSNSSPKGSASA